MNEKEGKPSNVDGVDVQISQALARGYCYGINSGKTVDPVLISAMVVEVEKLIAAREQTARAEGARG